MNALQQHKQVNGNKELIFMIETDDCFKGRHSDVKNKANQNIFSGDKLKCGRKETEITFKIHVNERNRKTFFRSDRATGKH